jgi:aminoglycoside phosphotransferase (APT) family kinase protein
MWQRLRELPRHGPDLMCHKDLIPGNLLVVENRLVGVLDVGGLGPADPALDLVVAWHVLNDGPRRVLRDELGCGDVEWERGRAWAFQQAMGLVWYYAKSNPSLSQLGRRTLMRLMSD